MTKLVGILVGRENTFPPAFIETVNTKGALGLLQGLTTNPELGQLIAGRDPILVVFDGAPERIHAASRNNISGMIMDAMLIGSLGQSTLGEQAAPVLGP